MAIEPTNDDVLLAVQTIAQGMHIMTSTLNLIHDDIKLILDAAVKERSGKSLHDALEKLYKELERNTAVLERMDNTLAGMAEQ